MLNRYFRELSVAAALGLILALLAVFAPHFYDRQPLLSRLAAAAPKLVVACGLTLVILTRQIDISSGSVFAVCSVIGGHLTAQNVPLTGTAIATILIGALAGTLNGALVAGLQLPSIVVTLATMVTFREGLRLAQQGVFVNLPDPVQWFGFPMSIGQLSICFAALAVLTVLSFTLKYVAAGRWLYAIGSDAEAARLSGLRPRLTTFWVFVLFGALTGLAAMLNLVQSPQVDPATGRLLELEAIAAAVVGGVAISGGRGRLWGVLAGLLLLTCVSPALTYLGVKPYWDKAIQGAVLLFAVMTDGLRSRSRRT